MDLFNQQTTVPHLLRNVVKHIHPATNTFLIRKTGNTWEEISFETTLDNADAISSYFLEAGISKGDRLAFIIENCPEYVYYDQALQQIGCINTSIYPTLSEAEIEYILLDSGAKTILVGSPFLLKKVIKIANHCPDLIRIIPVFNDFQKITEKAVLNAGVLSLDQVIEEGKNKLNNYSTQIDALRASVMPSDISSLIYTSGTTGTPKGVMLTHSNFVENVKVCLEQIPVIDENETFLSFLPLSHVFERTATYHVCCAKGCKIAFAQSLELLAKNMGEVKPTVMSCVPRLLEKIHDKAIKGGTAAGGTKAKIFLWALEVGQKHREVKEAGKSPNFILSAKHSIAEKLVFSKIKEKTGGRLKFMISGGAALPKNVGEFFGNLGIKILEGFGLTETSPVISVNVMKNFGFRIGSVGKVLEGIDVKIAEDGEILCKGPNVMLGYYKDEEKTKEVLNNGYFHTGDIGEIDADGVYGALWERSFLLLSLKQKKTRQKWELPGIDSRQLVISLKLRDSAIGSRCIRSGGISGGVAGL